VCPYCAVKLDWSDLIEWFKRSIKCV
jgi:hypothetical protein